jgi:hypothetical protein
MAEKERCSFCGKLVGECVNGKPAEDVIPILVPNLGLVGPACWLKALLCYGLIMSMSNA